jgi:D-cysteine desulfhydrase family pyridoxal phosphate-dependent enzyme
MIQPPRLRFAHLPTPIEAMPRLSKEMGGVHMFIKRDDLTGLALGGNKTRKLEFLLAEAQANAARTLITAGAVQSNHCRQTAAAAARYGLDCILVLTGEPEPSASGNLLLDQTLGARLVWTSREKRDETLQKTFQTAWEEGLRPFLIPYGGSNPTGALAYAFALKEMLDQAADSPMSRSPDWIVFPTSSGGTQAGLTLGASLFDYPGKILGISVDEQASILQERVASLAHGGADLLGERIDLQPDDILVDDSYLGQGYGVLSQHEIDAIHLFARSEGMLLDPVYTGRAAGGLLDLHHKGAFKAGEVILFWHTGGTPALFAEKYNHLLTK